MIEVGEYGLALEDLAAMIPYDKIAATDQERDDIEGLAQQMGMDLGPSWEQYCPKCRNGHGPAASGCSA